MVIKGVMLVTTMSLKSILSMSNTPNPKIDFEHLHVDHDFSILDKYGTLEPGLTGAGFTKEEADELFKDRKPIVMTTEERKKYLDWLKQWSKKDAR